LEVATYWGIASRPVSLLRRRGKLSGTATVTEDMVACVASKGCLELPISGLDGQLAGEGPNRDRFDRMPAAQVMVERLVLASNEGVFACYNVRPL
jgi:PIN domain nuclease of toxin-antitoxin system